ncbi:MAG: arginyltransferase [Pseudomonadales bacterium]
MNEELGQKQFFVTPGHPCSYLDNREATTLFLDPRETVSAKTYEVLSENGFRRSGGHLYRPHCRRCQACMATRIPVLAFQSRRRHRRVLDKNADLAVVVEPGQLTDAHYELYARYISTRHGDGDMYPPSEDQFRSFLLGSWSETLFVSSYLRGQLVAVAVTDRQPRGLSAIYTYFEPSLPKRSLGMYSILQQLALCERWALPYLYLGFWIRDSPKMSYKLDYRPIEILVENRWLTLS